MKNIKSILLIFSLLISSLFSCNDNLELNPISEISNANFWKTENDATAGLYGMYVKLRTPASSSFFCWGEGRSEVMGPTYLGAVADFNLYYYNALDATNSAATYNGGNTTWQNLYTFIHHANLLLKNVPNISFRSEEAKNDILAQAYTTRAFIYFLLVKIWGDAIIVTDPLESLDPASIQKPRSPVADVFKLIKDDLDRAISLYPTANIASKRNVWSKPSANILKADVYLWSAKRLAGGDIDLNVALQALDQAEQSDVILLDKFSDVFAYSNKGNKEIMMSVTFSELEVPVATDRRETRFMYIHPAIPPNISDETRAAIGAPSPNGGYWSINPETCSQFSEDDQRRNATFYQIFTIEPDGSEAFYATLAYKFRGTVVSGSRVFLDDVVLYRYSDLLLLRAEAKSALNLDPSDDINKVRKRAYGTAYQDHVFVNGSKEENDEAILQERLLEFTLEGKRWFDLIRFNKVFEKVPSLQDRAGQDYLLLFPIPEVTLSLENQVKQNPGYSGL